MAVVHDSAPSVAGAFRSGTRRIAERAGAFTVRLPVWRDGLYGEASEGYPSTDSE